MIKAEHNIYFVNKDGLKRKIYKRKRDDAYYYINNSGKHQVLSPEDVGSIEDLLRLSANKDFIGYKNN